MITDIEALVLAKEFSVAKGWRWLEPVRVKKINHCYGALCSYCIITHCTGTGMNIKLEISASDGKVIKSGYNSR